MTTPTRRRRATVLLAALACLAASLLLAAPASAEEKVITITAEGVTPKVLEVAAGDTITFVNEDSAFGYRAEATSDNWDLDSGPVGLLPGRSYTHPDPITGSGVYTYRVAEGEPYEGSVVLPGGTSPRPTPSRTASSAPRPSSAPSSTAPSPSPTGGTGQAQPPVTGGFGTVDPSPGPSDGGAAPPPAIALPELPAESAGPQPETAPVPDAEPEAQATTAAAVPGTLASPPTARGYGLPAAIAAVLAAGVASLLVRLLLAEPAARRTGRAAGLARPAPAVAVD